MFVSRGKYKVTECAKYTESWILSGKVFSFSMLILIKIAVHIVTSCFSLNTGKI